MSCHVACCNKYGCIALSGVIGGDVEMWNPCKHGWMYYTTPSELDRSKGSEALRLRLWAPRKGFRSVPMLVLPLVSRIGNRFLLFRQSQPGKLPRSHLFQGETGNGRRTARCCCYAIFACSEPCLARPPILLVALVFGS
jgi:hypothetical protein